MTVSSHTSNLEGPTPGKPKRPSCDFDIPENMPVFDEGRSEGLALEDKVVDGDLSDALPPVLLGAKEEEELQLRFAHDYRLLQDSAVALKSLVMRELDSHRQLTEKLLTRQHDRPGGGVTGVVRRPVSHVLEAPPVVFDGAGGTGRKSSAMGRDSSTAFDSTPPQGMEFGHVDTNSTHGQSEKHSVYQDFRTVAQMAFAATQALVPSRKESRDSMLDRQISPASLREGDEYMSPRSQPRDSDLSALAARQRKEDGEMPASLVMEHIKISGMPTWAYDKKRDEITDSYNRMKIHGRKSGQVLLGWAGFEDVVESHNPRSWEETMTYGRDSCLCNTLRDCIKSHAFSSTIASLILLNAVFIGVAANDTLSRLATKYDAGETPFELTDASEPWERAIDLAFTSVFGVELILRLFAFQLAFFMGPEWRWNLLDSCIVLLAFFELVLQHYSFGESWARLFRLVRLARSLRVMRVLRFFRQLRLMLISVLSSLIPLLWAVVFLLLVLFVFSVLIAYGVSQWFAEVHKDQVDREVSEQILRYFGNMSMVLISHFIAVTGGISWWELATLLKEISWAYVLVFIVYVTVTMLMVLNIITGIFVNDSIEIAQTDREFASEALMQKEKNVFKELERTFHELDVDGDGLLYFEEFEQKVKDPAVRAVFSALNLDVTDALRFFRLLDVDKSNAVEIDEFVMGCMNVKGQVGTISLEAMMAENKRMMRGYMKAQRKLEEVVTKHFTAMQGMLKDRSLVPMEADARPSGLLLLDEPKRRQASFAAS